MLHLGRAKVVQSSGKAIKCVLLEHGSKILWIPRSVLLGDAKDLETLDEGELTVEPALWWIRGMMRSDRELFEDIRADIG